jgi:hypothetical protein
MRLNQPIVGLVIGLLMPLLGLIVVYFVLAKGMSFEDFLTLATASGDFAGKVITLSVLANLIPFLYFSRRRLDYTVKGIVIATILYMVLFIYMKFVR